MKHIRLSIKFSIRLVAFISLVSWTALASAQEGGAPFQAGVDYSLLQKNQVQGVEQLSDLESVSNIEFFYWLGCEACYHVELGISKYLRERPDLSIRRTPLVARVKWRPQAYLQPILSLLSSQQPDLKIPTIIDLYKQCLTDCTPFESYDAIKIWLSQKIRDQNLSTFNEKSIWSAEKNFQKRAGLFSITQVPTIIINERYKVTAKQARTAARLIKIIDYLITH